MEEESSKSSGRTKPGKDKDGDEEMTVVVPPPKAAKLPGASQKDDEGDVTMNGTAEVDVTEPTEPIEDPKNKAATGMPDDHFFAQSSTPF